MVIFSHLRLARTVFARKIFLTLKHPTVTLPMMKDPPMTVAAASGHVTQHAVK